MLYIHTVCDILFIHTSILRWETKHEFHQKHYGFSCYKHSYTVTKLCGEDHAHIQFFSKIKLSNK